MDPFTALSLACGIIQVVDFSTKVVKKCRELYKDGAKSQNEDIENMASHLTGLRMKLNVPNQRQSDDLLDLGRKCSDTAEALIKELQSLKVKRPRKTLEVVSKTFKSVWKKRTIDDIWERLEIYRRNLDTHILVDLRKCFDLSSLQQSQDFGNLDGKIQMMIKSLAAGSKRLDEISISIHSESESAIAHITNEFQQHQMNLADNDYLKRFLESLWFPQINRRQETIKEAHAKTFQWIFEAGGARRDGHRWDDFVQWLKQGQSTYWIHGKAGSGKSTLMNYIYQDDRTHDALKAWSGAKELLTPSFFFWNAGGTLEKSSEGLLRSLLHQILERYPDKTPVPASARSARQDYGPISAWTVRRLQTSLRYVMHHLKDTCRICIFIDGLDEFIGDQNALVTTIKELQSTEIKTCLSSRPDQSYGDAFSSSANLKLQDLTKADIKVFVSDKLRAPLRARFTEDTTQFFSAIVEKADGVFLWVGLVVNAVLRGLQTEDSLEQLYIRLRLMPPDIEGLYAHMLYNIDEVHRIEAAKFFHMALAGLTGSLLDVSLALYSDHERASGLLVQDAIRLCDFTKKRIPPICAGLLETHRDDDHSQAEELWGDADIVQLFLYERSIHVNFHHRTAVEFLQESEHGKRFMEAHSSSSWNPYSAYVRALLAKISLLGVPKIPADMVVKPNFKPEPTGTEGLHSSFVYEVMKKVNVAERYTGVAQVLLCEHVDRTLTVIYQQRFGQSTNTHWCTQWGFRRVRMYYESHMALYAWPTSSPQFSLAKSYPSLMSELETRFDPQKLPTKPADFLGLACSCGLSCYVHQALNSRLEIHDRETATYLLCCSMWAFYYDDRDSRYVRGTYFHEVWNTVSSRWLGPLRLIGELLNRGADPNFYVKDFSATIWGEFVRRLKHFADKGQSLCGEIAKIFVENGANLQESVHIKRQHILNPVASLEEPIELGTENECVLFYTQHEVTTLYLIRRYLSGTPGCEAFEKSCLSKGVGSFSRWTHIMCLEGVGQSYEVTDVQRDKFGPAMRESMSLDKPLSFTPEYSRQIAELLEETSKSGDYSHQDLSDEEVTSDDTGDFHSASSRISLIS